MILQWYISGNQWNVKNIIAVKLFTESLSHAYGLGICWRCTWGPITKSWWAFDRSYTISIDFLMSARSTIPFPLVHLVQWFSHYIKHHLKWIWNWGFTIWYWNMATTANEEFLKETTVESEGLTAGFSLFGMAARRFSMKRTTWWNLWKKIRLLGWKSSDLKRPMYVIQGGFHKFGESPIAGWLIIENPNLKWMI